jgi:hypothetical protein
MLVPFGQYKGEPVEALLTDEDYCMWLLRQTWFTRRYSNLANQITKHWNKARYGSLVWFAEMTDAGWSHVEKALGLPETFAWRCPACSEGMFIVSKYGDLFNDCGCTSEEFNAAITAIHQQKFDPDPKPEPKPESKKVRCQGTTREGKPCGGSPKIGQLYCAAHSDQDLADDVSETLAEQAQEFLAETRSNDS